MERLFAIAGGILLIASICFAENLSSEVSCLEPKNIFLAHQWDVDDDTQILCVATHNNRPSPAELACYEGSSGELTKIYSMSPGDYPISIFSTSDVDPKLITIWVSGSAYILRIFYYEDGKITQVLEVGSKMMPEFVYPSAAIGKGQQRIVVSTMDWVSDLKTGQAVLQPVLADVYQWSGTKFVVKKGIPWKKRFQK